ncbi:MAG: hypothetical protein GXY44_00610 [Phycisphaerales bacterium]|nr:hypothetical protein [Phycisphaerales bacterium]
MSIPTDELFPDLKRTATELNPPEKRPDGHCFNPVNVIKYLEPKGFCGSTHYMDRYAARYNVDNGCWEVFDTLAQKAIESFSCRNDEELRHYAEHRALAHAFRMNQQNTPCTEDQPSNQ